MKMLLMAIGGILIIFGLVDLIGSFLDFDLWGGFMGVQLPELLWKYSAYIELIAGFFIYQIGASMGEDEQEIEESQ